MIKISFFTNDDNEITGFDFSGHAGFAESGNDIRRKIEQIKRRRVIILSYTVGSVRRRKRKRELGTRGD